MRIVHWNTHHSGIGSDLKLDTRRIGKALALLSPDVVTLNEVEQFDGYGNQDVVNTICAELGAGWTGIFATISGALAGKGQGNAILARTPLLNPAAKGLWQTRSAVSATVNGVNIVATHLSNTSANDRCVQMTELLSSDLVRDKDKIILIGDWNAHQGNVELSPLYAHYADAWNAAQGRSAFNLTGATHGTSRIDIAFVKGYMATHIDVPDTRVDTVWPSDHNAVVVDI